METLPSLSRQTPFAFTAIYGEERDFLAEFRQKVHNVTDIASEAIMLAAFRCPFNS